MTLLAKWKWSQMGTLPLCHWTSPPVASRWRSHQRLDEEFLCHGHKGRTWALWPKTELVEGSVDFPMLGIPEFDKWYSGGSVPLASHTIGWWYWRVRDNTCTGDNWQDNIFRSIGVAKCCSIALLHRVDFGHHRVSHRVHSFGPNAGRP